MSRFLKILLSIMLIINFSAFQVLGEKKKRIAIPDFENNTGITSLEHLEKGLAVSLSNQLAGTLAAIAAAEGFRSTQTKNQNICVGSEENCNFNTSGFNLNLGYRF